MSIFNRQTAVLLKRAGTEWTTDINGECITFYGVFDAENRLEDDNSGLPILIAGSVLTALSSITTDFVFNQQLTDEDGTIWYCRETLKVDDGFLSHCHLTEKPE